MRIKESFGSKLISLKNFENFVIPPDWDAKWDAGMQKIAQMD